MNEKNYLLISAIVFAIVAVLHLIRAIAHWSVQVGTMSFPVWGSWLAVLFAVGLCVWALRLRTTWRQTHL
jgi:hypothetical protein